VNQQTEVEPPRSKVNDDEGNLYQHTKDKYSTT